MDFVLHIDPTFASGHSGGDEAAARIDERRTLLLLLSINQTDHDVLPREPLVVRLETKKVAADRAGSEAQVQMGTWQTAQWNLLANLVAISRTSSGESDADNGLRHLPLLPGVVIQGRDWAVVATMREDKKTIFFFLERVPIWIYSRFNRRI